MLIRLDTAILFIINLPAPLYVISLSLEDVRTPLSEFLELGRFSKYTFEISNVLVILSNRHLNG